MYQNNTSGDGGAIGVKDCKDPRVKNLIGKRFGRLVVVKRVPKPPTIKNRGAWWLCICDEGNVVSVRSLALTSGNTKSCGCLQKEVITKHNHKKTKLYNVWARMKQRCANPNDDSYKNYAERGINYCADWEFFLPFMEWAYKNGYKSSLQLNRVNNDRGYSPDNCEWTTRSGNMRNTRNNRVVKAFGEVKSTIEWSEDVRCVVSAVTLRKRVNSGWIPEKAITAPSQRASAL